jgi:hypothetical protein
LEINFHQSPEGVGEKDRHSIDFASNDLLAVARETLWETSENEVILKNLCKVK